MSPLPGRIVAEIDVPFPYPRETELRYDPSFADLTGAVSSALRGSFRSDAEAELEGMA